MLIGYVIINECITLCLLSGFLNGTGHLREKKQTELWLFVGLRVGYVPFSVSFSVCIRV